MELYHSTSKADNPSVIVSRGRELLAYNYYYQ
jgi:hypothetical protein